MDQLRPFIRNVPDFPSPGIMFKDITPLLNNGPVFRETIRGMAKRVERMKVTRVVGIESRGFIFASALAYELGAGLVIFRKPRKLPYKTTRIEYALEYGSDCLESHIDAIIPGESVLVVDDILATGGTALAACRLVESLGGTVQGLIFLSELVFLKGRDRLPGYEIHSLLDY